MEYVEASEARNLSGLRLALTVGVPGPWSQAAKSILEVKNIAFVAVAQHGGLPNDDLLAWTGHSNAPVAVYEDQPARAGWAEILMLAERLEPSPRLIPEVAEDRADMFGISHEICGELGFGWCRRLMFLDEIISHSDGAADVERMVAGTLADKYGYSPEAGRRAPGRVAEVLGLLARRLHAQRSAGSPYLVGRTLSAADIYWACFAALIDPLPPEVNPMPEMIRAWYEKKDRIVTQATDPLLLEHRDYIYAEHLRLPLDF